MHVDEAIRTRRSVRKYTDQPVSDSDVQELLELALLAPNSSNLQPWGFYWVRTPKLRAEMNAAFLSQSAALTAPVLLVVVARTATWRQHAREMVATVKAQGDAVPPVFLQYYEKLVPVVYTVGWLSSIGYLKSFLFFVIGLFRPTPRGPVSRSEMITWAVKSTALACENIMIAARARGLDTCPMEGFDERRVKRLLGLPRDAIVVMGISLGHRDPVKGHWGKQIRYPSMRFIHRV